MPRGDGTGPMGAGAMTGRGMGFCAGYSMPGYANATPWAGGWGGFSRGRGFGFGGRGRRFGMAGWTRFGAYNAPYGYTAPYPQVDPQTEKQALKSQADFLQTELEQIRKRLEEIESAKEN
ncbi:MAG: DUF5320 domain-containing protein [Syntrophaceae bacterium]|nr:DUF5320 domain-containing protein [Syntrophaceae bacterium]